MVFPTSLFGAPHKMDCVDDKPASLLVESLDNALNGMPPPLCGKQVVGPSLTKDRQTKHELISLNEILAVQNY